MPDMFCFQCQQTAGGTGCVRTGVCGKQPHTAQLQDALICELIRLAQAAQAASRRTEESDRLLIDGLFTTLTNVNFDDRAIHAFTQRAAAERRALGGADAPDFPLWKGETDIVSLRSTLLFGLKGMAAYAHHALRLGKRDESVTAWFYKGLCAVAEEHTVEEWLALIMEFGSVNLQCMALLDRANTGRFGDPVPTRVRTDIQAGPLIVVSGHDLLDLEQLLEQTQGTGVRVYTHCEMLPAHGYPGLHKYPHLAGNFGTAWQSQQREFEDIPAPILFTTNCIMPLRASYADRVFTTSVVAYPGVPHIDEGRDFSPVIEKALELGGYAQDTLLPGLNGGSTVTTGFARTAVLQHADEIVQAVRDGKLRHFFLVGGCDGTRPSRRYYTEFARLTPPDTILLTLACGKFRLNDLPLGTVPGTGLPRILDVGQCNDAYSAIRIALALADAFGCGVNDLPLSLVLCWFEQKAVCILIALLALGIRNIRLGPTLPPFLSPGVVRTLQERYGLKPIATPEADLQAILGG